MELQIISATDEDLIILTEMNRQLIADEGSQNPMNDEQLKQRMQDWILGNWNDVYLRQYFIKREYRNNGHGITGIEKLKQETVQ